MTDLDPLIDQVRDQHFPNPPASLETIRRAEQRLGFHLPEDLVRFYTQCNGAYLFEKPDSPYFILPIERLRRTRVDIYGEDEDRWGPATWYSVCDVQDGNIVAIDTRTVRGETCWFIDCFHETFLERGYCKIIALSFTEFLSRALKSQSPHFWLADFKGYGDARETPLV
jgi:hypothetical protein